jgi:hypothetical protein
VLVAGIGLLIALMFTWRSGASERSAREELAHVIEQLGRRMDRVDARVNEVAAANATTAVIAEAAAYKAQRAEERVHRRRHPILLLGPVANSNDDSRGRR